MAQRFEHPGLLAGGVVILLYLAYWPALTGDFIWDDPAHVSENPLLHSLDGLRRIWFELGASVQYYPMVYSSFWFEYQLWGLNTFGYHVINVALHAINGLLLWRLGLSIRLPGAGLLALLFLFHPVHVESVAWISERKNVLSGAFYLASALAWFRFSPVPEADDRDRESEAKPQISEPRRKSYYFISALLFLLALLSKTVSISLPAAILLVIAWHKGRLTRSDVVPLLPFFAIGIGFGLITIGMEEKFVGAVGKEWSLTGIERFMVACRSTLFYLGKILWPVDLSFIYPRWEMDQGQIFQWVFPVAILGILSALILLRHRIGRGPMMAALFFGGTLFPALGFVNLYPHRFSYVADHFQYLASLGPLSLIAASLANVFRRPGLQKLAVVGISIAILFMAGMVRSRAEVYRNSVTLWSDTLQVNPDSYLAHSILGNIRIRQDRHRDAIVHYREALRIKPEDPISLNNLAWGLAIAPSNQDRRPAEAVALAIQAAETTEYRAPEILETLSIAYAADGQYAAAIRTVKGALEIYRRAGDQEKADGFEDLLQLFRERRPYHSRRLPR
jgi:tetratricopeptide (TPR) repeat protein